MRLNGLTFSLRFPALVGLVFNLLTNEFDNRVGFFPNRLEEVLVIIAEPFDLFACAEVARGEYGIIQILVYELDAKLLVAIVALADTFKRFQSHTY